MADVEAAGGGRNVISLNTDTSGECGMLWWCCACSIFCGGPLTAWYYTLPEDEQLQVECATSFILGVFDNVFDYIVAYTLFTNGNPIWAIGILIAILLAGGIPFYAVLFDDWHVGLDSRDNYLLAFAYLLGFGVYYDAYQTIKNPRVHHDKFELVRIFEVVLESIPSGAIQIFATCSQSELEQDPPNNVQIASLCGSVLSIAYGIVIYWDREGTKFLSVDFTQSDRFSWANNLFQPLLGIFVATDFVFRVTSMAYFIITFEQVRRWLVLAVWIPSVVLCMSVSSCASDTKSNPIIAFLMSLVTIASSFGLFIIVIDKRAGFKFWAYEWTMRFLINLGFCASSFYYRPSQSWLNVCIISGLINVLTSTWLYCLVGERFASV